MAIKAGAIHFLKYVNSVFSRHAPLTMKYRNVVDTRYDVLFIVLEPLSAPVSEKGSEKQIDAKNIDFCFALRWYQNDKLQSGTDCLFSTPSLPLAIFLTALLFSSVYDFLWQMINHQRPSN